MSITPSLVASRTSGAAPLYVHFDATATDSTATTYEFHECKFTWSFGDASAGTFSTTGKSRNTAYGPMAAHVFESGGTFTVTLTVKDTDGTTASTTQDIVVTASDAAWPTTSTTVVSQTGTWTGEPTGATRLQTSNWADVVALIASNRRILLRRGETWTVTSSTTIPRTATVGYFGSFGSGTVATITCGTAGVTIFTLNGDDWRFCDLLIQGNNSGISVSSGFNLNNAYNTSGTDGYGVRNILISRCEVRYCVDNIGGAVWYVGANVLVSKLCCSYESNVHHGPSGSYNYGWSANGLYHAILGSNFSYGGGPGGGHNIRLSVWSHFILSHSVVSHNQSSLRLSLKLHSEVAYVAWWPYSHKAVISDCSSTGGSSQTYGFDVGPQDMGSAEDLRDILVERCWVKCAQRPFVLGAVLRGTIRNCIAQNTSFIQDDFYGIWVTRYGVAQVPDRIWVYNNTIYDDRTRAGDTKSGVLISNGTNVTVRNNYASFPGAAGIESAVTDSTGTALVSNNTVTDTPGFATAGSNFHLVAGSAAINTGSAVATVYDDYDNVTRVANYEQGAFEYASGGDPGTAIIWGVVT